MPSYYIKNVALGTVDRVHAANPRKAAKLYVHIHHHDPFIMKRLRVVDDYGYKVKEYRVVL